MKKRLLKVRSNKGTALIVALLIMSVLVAISLALASLIFKEVKITRDLLNAGKAYYMAEAGIERALYELNSNLPGVEVTPEEDDWSEISATSGSKFKYGIKNQCESYPCVEEDMDFSNLSFSDSEHVKKAFYDVLPLNQTITVPLFIVEKDDAGIYIVKPIKDFTVEYFADFGKAGQSGDSQLRFDSIQGWDILRWKIFAMKKFVDGSYATDSMSDFVPVTVNSLGANTNATQPSWFGTSNIPCLDRKNDVAGFPIECIAYDALKNWFVSEENTSCSNIEARDHYKYTWWSSDSKYLAEDDVKNCYSIQKFVAIENGNPGLNNATGLNYLTLTNMMNPSMFKGGSLKNRTDWSTLYFRIEVGKDPEDTDGDSQQKIVREYADITSDGISGDSVQSINVKIKRNSYMPVFNFAVYSTYGKNDYYSEYSSISLPSSYETGLRSHGTGLNSGTRLDSGC